jgi:glycosyltransferase involved in cell wall biosynthesis
MIISVVIPTYRRPKDLLRCLEALGRQVRRADEVIIVVRDTDAETWDLLKISNHEMLELSLVTVRVTGVIAAMNSGLDASHGDIIAFTDDDAAPHSDWLKRIETHFIENSTLGGIGGRDYIYINDQLWQGEEQAVGQLLWFGKMVGNHHLGVGAPRQADILKGVNMSFRRTAISGQRFDSRLLGSGAQVHFEVEFCLRLRKAGWTLIYDPLVAVDHYFSQRYDEDQRNQFNELAFFNEVYNETLALMDYLSPIRKLVFFIWSLLIGHSRALGLLQLLRYLPKERNLAFKKWQLSVRGRWQGWETWNNLKKDSSSSH